MPFDNTAETHYWYHEIQAMFSEALHAMPAYKLRECFGGYNQITTAEFDSTKLLF